MSTRRILHHGPTPNGTPVLLSDRTIAGCWFELQRQGGCGPGELVVQRNFSERNAIEIGDWISCEAQPGERWYLGRVEECRFQFPGLLRLRLAGMGIELNELFPGGFDASPNEQRPHRYGETDLFSNDPDRAWEQAYHVSTIDGLVRLLMEQHVTGHSHIIYDSTLIEGPVQRTPLDSLKFRGEESLRSILKDLALRAQASWGVDAHGKFFFLRRRSTPQVTLRIGRDLTSVEETRDRELLFNRLLLTGDYIYDQRDNSGQIARRVYRWRANFFEPESCSAHGNRRLRLWVPWIRTQPDSLAFARSFFRTYGQPTCRYAVETLPQTTPMIPWQGPVTIEDQSGAVLASAHIEKVRVLFDHAPRFRMEIGPEDPRELWAEPPQDERWELPDHVPSNGGEVSVTEYPSDDGSGDSSENPPPPSDSSSGDSSSDHSSDASSSGSLGSSGSDEYGTSSDFDDETDNSHSSTSTVFTSDDLSFTDSSFEDSSQISIDSSLSSEVTSSGLVSSLDSGDSSNPMSSDQSSDRNTSSDPITSSEINSSSDSFAESSSADESPFSDSQSSNEDSSLNGSSGQITDSSGNASSNDSAGGGSISTDTSSLTSNDSAVGTTTSSDNSPSSNWSSNDSSSSVSPSGSWSSSGLESSL